MRVGCTWFERMDCTRRGWMGRTYVEATHGYRALSHSLANQFVEDAQLTISCALACVGAYPLS